MVRLTSCVLLTVLIANCLAQESNDSPTWQQKSLPQKTSSIQTSGDVSVESTKGVTDRSFGAAEFNAGASPVWIWGSDNNRTYKLRTTFSTGKVVAAYLKFSCDNVGRIFINGERIAVTREWSTPLAMDVTKYVVEGENVLEARVTNEGGVAGFVLKLAVRDSAGQVSHVTSNTEWKNTTNDDKVVSRGNYGDGPWGRVFDNASGLQGRVANDVFEVQPGFHVEKLFTVPKDELGSWVCLAEDNKGRLLASDQGNKGICRITLPPIAGEGSSIVETVVERLDFSKCEVQPTGAQGMLFAFGSLYISINGGPGSGLYRARDTTGDDQFDECVLLKRLEGGGEHGPHSLRLSPDGKRIFLIAGNHTDPPFKSGEEKDNERYRTRMPSNWAEDLLLPRMWDANGHARGKLAPGGWIASTDPDGESWEIWSIGYRNPYDMAFNADGELFAYDADMEWDVGSPWYRPTRVVHATSGSEFGWRSGTGKWPTHYLDSLPPLVDVGPGSPVGVDFGYGLKFPERFQKALYICDWTFGTMYAIHPTPVGSTYAATKEEFVARNALPLTDVVAASDGALYFTVGGRGTQSELYRVTYRGDASTTPAELTDTHFAKERADRNRIEMQTHRVNRDTNHSLDDEAGLAKALGSEDRFVRYAGLVGASRRVPLKAGKSGLTSDRARIAYLAALARRRPVKNEAWEAKIVEDGGATIQAINYTGLADDLKLDYLRAVSLCLMRRPAIVEKSADSVREVLETDYPSGNRPRDRELCQVLVYLNSSPVVQKTVALMNQPPQRQDIDMRNLLARNAGYGRAINAMIDNQPDKQQIWYAFCLRVAKRGWTDESRADYFRWFGKALKWSGGNSFRKFLQNIENEAYEGTTENERVMLEARGARSPFKVAELPNPAGPGKSWSVGEVRSLAKKGLRDRDFANGKKMFAATRCVVCHRFAGDGGATGPDLTQLAGRFNLEALTEAIMEPSRVISDQYKASAVTTVSGRTVVGRIVSENASQISVLTDPEDSTAIVDISKDDVDEMVASSVSIMPSNLLNPLNENEVLDLLAYLLSRGDARNGMFKK